MQKIVQCFIMLSAICMVPVNAHPLDGKLYVNPSDVHVVPEGIFVEIDHNFVSVRAVSSDAQGIYVVGYDGVSWTVCRKCKKTYDRDNQSSKCPHDYTAHH